MRAMRFAFVMMGLVLAAPAAKADSWVPDWVNAPGEWVSGWFQGGPNIKGNDTGGIMFWTPETEKVALLAADDFCKGWHKYARITSVHRNYGDTIAFNCLWSPTIGPYILPRVRVHGGDRLYEK